MKKIFLKYYPLIGIGSLTIFVIYLIVIPKFDFRNNGKFGIAKIYDFYFLGKQGSCSMYYTYKVNDFVYKQSTSIESIGIGQRSKLLYKYFPIIYNPEKPEESVILITKRDFEHYNINYPDSLKWVEENR